MTDTPMTDATLSDATAQTEAADAQAPAALFDSFTPENVGAFANGELNFGQLLGLRAEEAYGIAQMAYNLAENGKLEDAAALAEGLVTLVPEDPYFHALVASIYIRQERLEEALVELDHALARRDDDIDSYVNRGEIHLHQGDLEAALSDFRAAIDLDPGGEHPMGQRARMLVAVAKVVFDGVVEHRRQAGA
ncbi:MAG: tetratricopeptide repeat protein [Acidobacteriota bacterium]